VSLGWIDFSSAIRTIIEYKKIMDVN